MWADRHTASVAGQLCPVPSLLAQRLILILHAVRGGSPDVRRAWVEASDVERAEVDALAAATGRLEQHRSAREYLLWHTLSTGNFSRTTLWRSGEGEPNPLLAARTAFRPLAPRVSSRVPAPPPHHRRVASGHGRRARPGRVGRRGRRERRLARPS